MATGRVPVDLDPEQVKKACLDAADMISGMGYHGSHGSFHLLDLNLQANTVTAILHNMIAWQIGRIDPRWTFRPKGGGTPDLTSADGGGIQVKVTSDKKIKGNFVSSGSGYYVAVKFRRKAGSTAVEIAEILVGWLEHEDWDRREGTQWAMLTPAAESRMKRIYPS
jgi:hypothetical protein